MTVSADPLPIDRETVYQALYTFLVSAAAATFPTISRRVKTPEQCMAAQGPFLFQVQKTESFTPTKGVPPTRDFYVDLVVYNNYGEDDTVVPSTALNALVTAVEDGLLPAAANAFQQLGIPISSCLINGNIEYFEGVLGTWSAAFIPVKLTAVY